MVNPNILSAIDPLSEIFLFAIAAIAVIAIAKSKGYFTLLAPTQKTYLDPIYVLSGFLIYLGVNFLLSPFIIGFFYKYFELDYIVTTSDKNILLMVATNLINNTIIFAALITLLWRLKKTDVWKTPFLKNSSYLNDIKMGFLSWFIAFPVVTVISNSIDFLLQNVFKVKEIPEQVAIQYVKETISHPVYFILIFITIAILAPFIEEFLFRGLLQTYFKNKFKRQTAIILTSVCFAVFHFSIQQRFSNITIILSLFVFSYFLGFLYEKQRSLLSPIILHSTFNSLSILSLLILKES